MAAQERCRQCTQTQEQSSLPIHVTGSASSGLSQLVGGVPPIPEAQEGAAEQETPRVNAGRPCRHPTKARPTPGGGGGSPPSHQNALEEQTQMTTLQPASLVEAAGIKDAGGQKEDWHQQN